jgi:membrane protease YdiL (CAAX protease family)
MSVAVILAFLFLTLSLLSLWVRRDPKIWGSLLALSLCSGLIGGMILWVGLIIILAWAFLWFFYIKQKRSCAQFALFVTIIILSCGFKFHLFPGYNPVLITPKFLIGFDSVLVGLFPIALLVPLASNLQDWKKAFKGLLFGCLGIAILALLAVASGAVHWQFKLPAFAATRYSVNLILTAIPEEGFYRGFVQNELCNYLKNIKGGKFIALLLSSIIFTLIHIYWSPTLDVLGFVFLAGLLYGGVYLISEKIESAILCHFLLNLIHMTFFSYHAM